MKWFYQRKMGKSDSIVRPVILGQFGPPTLACIRSWGMQGFPVGMVCIVSKKEPAPASKYLSDFVALPSEKLYTPDGIKLINDFLIKFCATGITCVAETVACWINDNRGVLPPQVAVWLPPNRTIEDLTSKLNQIEVARKVGFNVLPTYLVDRNLEAVRHIPMDHFPLCLRPTDPTTIKPVFKVKLIYSQTELKQFIDLIKELNRPIIAQPFRDLPNLVVHGARTICGENISLQGFLAERKFEGLALTVWPTYLDSELKDKCIAFTNHFNVTGSYHFDLMKEKDTDSVYFLEMNGRLGGTTAKVLACGYDEPLLVLKSYGVLPTSPETGNPKPASSNKQPLTIDYRPKNKIVSSKQALLKYFYYTLRGRLTALDYPSEPGVVRIAKTIYGFLKYKDDVFTLRDIKGSMALYLGNLMNKIPG
jgi:hypothetical protein